MRDFPFTVEIWDDIGNAIIEDVAGIGDFEVAQATYDAAVKRWPAARGSCCGKVRAW